MIICGVSIASSEAVMVWVDASSFGVVGGSKVELLDPYDKKDLNRTAELFRQLIVEKKTGKVVVRKSSTSGKFSAGHVCFRLETLIAMSVPCDVVFISAQGVSAFVKREGPVFPEGLKKYQQEAYLAVMADM